MFGAPFPGRGPMTVNYLGAGTALSSSNVDRYVVAVVGWSGGSLSGVTIAGLTATILAQGSNTVSAALAAAFIPAGVSGSVSLSSPTNSQVGLYEVIGWEGVATTTGTSSAMPSSVAVVASDNSVVISVIAAQDNVTTDPTAVATWTNLTKDDDVSYGVGGVRYMSCASRALQIASSFTATCSDTHTGTAQFCALATFYNS